MSYSYNFVDDVFISYRHLDNELLDEQGKGWIDNFHERFQNILGEALGYEPTLWRDPRLPGNAYFADVLEEKIKKTAVLISILSPGYLQSDWCIGELQEFCRLAEKTGGLLVGDRMRVFKVVKTHIEREQHPPEFKKQLGYEFYEIDKATQRPVAFGQELGRNRDQRYWSRLDDLAWDVKQVLSIINPRARTPSAVSVFSQNQGTISSRKRQGIWAGNETKSSASCRIAATAFSRTESFPLSRPPTRTPCASVSGARSFRFTSSVGVTASFQKARATAQLCACKMRSPRNAAAMRHSQDCYGCPSG